MINKFNLVETILLHLIPGIFLSVFYFSISYLTKDMNIPRAMILNVIALIVIPLYTFIIINIYKKKEGTSSFKDMIVHEKQSLKIVLLFALISFLWAGIIFSTIGKPINSFIKSNFFSWFPVWAEMTDILTNSFSPCTLIATWVLSLLGVVLAGPVFEEIYFRGFLLQRISGNKWTVLSLAISLFALYHFFSPWLLVTRIIAIIPLIYFTWKYRNIGIAIIGHCSLNLVGDVIGTIPVYFK